MCAYCDRDATVQTQILQKTAETCALLQNLHNPARSARFCAIWRGRRGDGARFGVEIRADMAGSIADARFCAIWRGRARNARFGAGCARCATRLGAWLREGGGDARLSAVASRDSIVLTILTPILEGLVHLQNVSTGLQGTPPPPPVNVGLLAWSRLSAAPAPIGGAEASVCGARERAGRVSHAGQRRWRRQGTAQCPRPRPAVPR